MNFFKSTIILFFISFSVSIAQKTEKPKLVVGIVVDQMRYDYLYRFYDKYSNNGFKRMMNEGFNCRNNQYQYASTITGPGHAHVYSGSVPAISGIVGNEWYDKVDNRPMYVVEDSTVNLVGIGSITAGKMSPKNLKVTTITDQLRISNQFKSKVIGIAIKDRGAILPAGHTGTAYWFDASKGNWISSTFYGETLPAWVTNFNNLKYPEQYASQMWETMLPIETYTETEDDDQPYEASVMGESKAVFPHKVTTGGIATTYFGNEITKNFALAALDAENLGKSTFTDFLAISFSSPDYAGHAFGPQSKEIEDIYLRLDKDIAEILTTLDAKIGVGKYTVFLTADHGVAEIPAFLKKNKVPAGIFTSLELKGAADKILIGKYGPGRYILDSDNYQLYLDRETLKIKGISVEEIAESLRMGMWKTEGLYTVINLEDANNANIPDYYKSKLTNIYNPKRSGEIMILLEPAHFAGYIKGTTHGTMYAYDTHVPLLFFGCGIKKGEMNKPTAIADIAPTLAQLLKILEPNGSVGTPISEALK